MGDTAVLPQGVSRRRVCAPPFAERLDIHFPEDEAGFIALHFVNAEYNTDIHDTYMITDVIQKGIEIVKAEYQKALDEKSMHYERFVAHLKFFARRIFFSKEIDRKSVV